jgi:hypothetical protein
MVDILMWLYFMAGMQVPTDLEMEAFEIYSMRSSAYEYAVQCSRDDSPVVSFDDISWHIAPGSNFYLATPEGLMIAMLGWFDPSGNVIYIPFERRLDFDLAVHEILHAFGYVGHPDHPFRTCGVDFDG